MTHRKHAAALLTAVLLLALTACGGQKAADAQAEAKDRRIRSRTDACGPGR